MSTGLLTAIAVGAVLLSKAEAIQKWDFHWCLQAPATIVDFLVRFAHYDTWLLWLIPVAKMLWTALRDAAAATKLQTATQTARLGSIPPRAVDVARIVGIHDLVDVVPSQQAFAFVYGWRRPRVCVSTELLARLSERELEAVLHHEQWHIQRRDPARLLAVRALLSPISFVPVVRRLIEDFRGASEIAADRYAVEKMAGKFWLASALAELLVSEPSDPRDSAFHGHAELRIAALADELPAAQHRSLLRITTAGLGALSVIGALTLASSQATPRGVGILLLC